MDGEGTANPASHSKREAVTAFRNISDEPLQFAVLHTITNAPHDYGVDKINTLSLYTPPSWLCTDCEHAEHAAHPARNPQPAFCSFTRHQPAFCSFLCDLTAAEDGLDS